MALDLTSFEKGINSLDEALTSYNQSAFPEGSKDRNLLRDAVIQRFEYTFELARKFLKRYMKMFGMEQPDMSTHKDFFRQAFEQGMIRDSAAWFEYLKKRNITSHTYDQEVAADVFKSIPAFLADAKLVLVRMKEKAVD